MDCNSVWYEWANLHMHNNVLPNVLSENVEDGRFDAIYPRWPK